MVRVASGTPGEAIALEARVIAGARAAVCRWGWRRTSVDDIAREAQVSRASVYRCFPGGRDAVMSSLLADERARFESLIAQCRAEHLDDTLVELLMRTARWFGQNQMLQFVLQHEPDLIGPHLAFAGGDRVLADAAPAVASLLAPFLPSDDGASERVIDWLTRLIRSHLLAPSPHVAFADSASVRRLVDRFIVPVFVGADREHRPAEPPLLVRSTS
ncbi:MAG: TetR/AcrR family transcriptional regulator [Acidimicrobiia bacterium]